MIRKSVTGDLTHFAEFVAHSYKSNLVGEKKALRFLLKKIKLI